MASLLSKQEVPRSAVAALVVSELKGKDAELAKLKAQYEEDAVLHKEVAQEYLQVKSRLDARWLLGAVSNPSNSHTLKMSGAFPRLIPSLLRCRLCRGDAGHPAPAAWHIGAVRAHPQVDRVHGHQPNPEG